VTASAIPLVNGYQSSVAVGGYAYAYTDSQTAPIPSTACVDSNALCGAGITQVADSKGNTWGAGVGITLNQAMATSSTNPPANQFPLPATSTGVRYALSALPAQGAKLIIDNAGVDYCANITAVTGTIDWISFNTKCWDGSGTALEAPPTATHLQFQATAVASATPFDFCVTSVAFP
jgi:hypothetical protein